jgi:GH25 family lysozyme M1 (1,4-beta-N-acetylmuramidase)
MNAKGLDLSRYNGHGNWQMVKAAGVSYVILKAGGVFSGAGDCYTDEFLEDHVAGARSVELPFGLYWFFLPFTSMQIQADYFLGLVNQYKPQLPLVVDVESSNGKNAKATTSALKALINSLQGSQKSVMIYTRQSYWDTNILADPFWASCELWASRWSSGLTSPWSDGYFKFRDWTNWRFWQYSGDNNALATSYGFPGNPNGDPDIDLNWYNGSEADFYTWIGAAQSVLTLEERVARLEAAVFGH